jgi:hypothetical protein
VITRRIQHLLKRLPYPISGHLVRRGLLIDRNRASDILFKVADTRDELDAAYRLVHDVYVKEGYSDQHESGMRVNLRYALPTTATVIGKLADQVVITLTVIGDSPLGLPMDMIFSEELYRLRCRGRYIAEVGALASHCSFRRRQQAIALFADKAIVRYAIRNLGADDMVIAVNPKHEWVYRHLLLFETISRGVKDYHYVNDAPAIAMRLDLNTCEERWRRAYAGRPARRNFHEFFIEDDPRQVDLPPEDGAHDVWDEELFSYFFRHANDPRREGHGSLMDLYRILYGLPEGRERRREEAPMSLERADAARVGLAK